MRYLWLILFAGCFDAPPPRNTQPPADTVWRTTQEGHIRSVIDAPGYSEEELDVAVDKGYSGFLALFPDLPAPTVNLVYIRPEPVFAVDGHWVSGYYVWGEPNITVSLRGGPLNYPCSLIP